MNNPKIEVAPSFDAGAFFVYINGVRCHVPFNEVSPHVADLLGLLDMASVEEPHISVSGMRGVDL